MKLHKTAPSSLWLLSFGDLVTLLLCFFISIIASTMQRQGLLGTTLAVSVSNPTREDPGLSLSLKPEMFNETGTELSETGHNLLKEGKKRWNENGRAIVVRGCLEEGELASSDAWLVSTSRVLAVSRQLFDSGAAPERISTEPVSKCASSAVLVDFEADLKS